MLKLRFAAVATLLLVGQGLVQAAEPAPSSADIAGWILALDSEDYAAREVAGQRLTAAGRAAISPVAKAILSDSPEVAWRANDVLEQIGISGDEETLELVSKALAEVSKSSKHSLAKSTSEVQRRWKRLRHERAVAQIAKLGGQVRGNADGDAVAFGGGFGFGGIGMAMPVEVEAVAEAIEAAPIIEDVEKFDVRPAKAILEDVPAEAPAIEAIEEAIPVLPARMIRPALRLPFGGRIEFLPVLPAIPDAPPGDPPGFKDLPLPVEDPFGGELEPPIGLPADPPPAKGFFGKVFRALRDVLPVAPFEDLEVPGVEEAMEPAEAIEMVEFAEVGAMMDLDVGVDVDDLDGGVDGVHAVRLGKEWEGGAEGLKLLKDVTQLSALELNELDLTDAYLEQIGQLPELRQLNLQRCRFERAALEKLAKSRPELNVLTFGEAVMGISGEPQGPGFHISFVAPNSGAQVAGLMVDDIVVRMAGEELKSFQQLTHVVASRKIGDKVGVEILRQGKKISLEVTLKAREATP